MRSRSAAAKQIIYLIERLSRTNRTVLKTGRVSAVDRSADEPTYRRGKKPKQEESGRLSSREIREIFEDIHPRDIFFTRNSSPKNKIENRMRRFRQRLARRVKSPRDRLNNAIRAIGRHGKTEAIRETKRVVRGEARRHLRRVLGIQLNAG